MSSYSGHRNCSLTRRRCDVTHVLAETGHADHVTSGPAKNRLWPDNRLAAVSRAHLTTPSCRSDFRDRCPSPIKPSSSVTSHHRQPICSVLVLSTRPQPINKVLSYSTVNLPTSTIILLAFSLRRCWPQKNRSRVKYCRRSTILSQVVFFSPFFC